MLVDPEFKAALKERAPLALLVEIDHPDGMVRFWSGIGSLEWRGNTYTGASVLGGVEVAKKAADLRISEVKFWLSDLTSDLLEQIGNNVRNRIARTYLAALSVDLRIRGEPYLIDEVLLDYQKDSIGTDGSARIELIGQSGFWTLQRSTDKAYSQEEWSKVYPDETGLSLIPSLQNKDTKWTVS